MTTTEEDRAAPVRPDGWVVPTVDGRLTDGSSASSSGKPRPRWVAPLATGAALAAGTALIALVDPGDSGTPICWSKSIFGIDCPLCGGLRATNALARGDFLAAADHNVLVAIALPFLAVLWGAWMIQSLRDRPLRLPRIPRPAIYVGILVLVAFTVVRNLDVATGWVHWLASGTA